MISKIGFFLFAGLMLGAIAGQLILGSPAVGAVALGALGAILGLALDYFGSEDDTGENL